MPDSETQRNRFCYCDLWITRPETFEKEDIPPGYCGICDICGKPGHMRHHPGSPSTGSWCDFHYGLLTWLHPTTLQGCLTWIALGVMVILLLISL